MGEMIGLTAGDGHELAAYRAAPAGAPAGGIVLLQEIFGLTAQMRRVADRYAAQGYEVVMPSMFDRIAPDMVLGYGEFQRGGQSAMSIPEAHQLADIEAARGALGGAGRIAAAGFCWGGSLAFLAACRLDIACAVSWYGGSIGRLMEANRPRVPVMYHFGAEDAFIPAEVIDAVRALDPKAPVFVYEGAGHGFCCDDREGFHAEAAALSERRSLDFLADHMAG